MWWLEYISSLVSPSKSASLGESESTSENDWVRSGTLGASNPIRRTTMNWIKKLFGGSGVSESSLPQTSSSDGEWLRGTTAETAYLFDSSPEYFNTACDALNAMGAERSGSVSGKDGAMVDEWKLKSGRIVYVGYKSSDNIKDILSKCL